MFYIGDAGEAIFSCGQLLVSDGVQRKLEKDEKYIQHLHRCLTRHFSGNFGDLCEEDRELNLKSIERGEGVIMSAFSDIWIMTTDQEYTTIFLAQEY